MENKDVKIWIPNQTVDCSSDEVCAKCGTEMLKRVRISIPFSHGSRTFQSEWFHCPKCNCMRKMISSASRERTKKGIENFQKELLEKGYGTAWY